MAEQREVQAIADQGAAHLAVQLAPARQLAADLAANQVGAVQALRLIRGSQRSLQHVTAGQRHDVDESPLRAPHVGACAEAADFERLDPARTRQQHRAAQPGMIDRGAVERVRVRLIRGAAPDLIGPGARRDRDQLPQVERGREQRDLTDRELGAQLGVGRGDTGRGSAHHQGVERERDQLEDEADLRRATGLDLDLLRSRAVPEPAHDDPVAPRFEVGDAPRAVGVGRGARTNETHLGGRQGPARGVDHAPLDAAARLRLRDGRKQRQQDYCAGAANGHVRPFHDQSMKHTAPSASAPRPNAMILGGVVAKMKIHPSSATRLGNG